MMIHLQSLRDGLLVWYRHHFSPGELAVFGGFILFGLVVMWGLNRVIGARVRAWARQRDPVLGDRITEALAAPLRVLVFCYFFVLGFDHLSGMPPSVWQNVHDLAPLVYLLAAFLFGFRCMDIVTEVLRRRWVADDTSLDERWARLVGTFGKVLLSILAVFLVLEKFTEHALSFLAGASVFGAAIALALQSTVANVIGSFEIMLDRLFKEGDRISFQDYDGFVTRMGLRSIQITSMTGEKITLPNKDLVDKQIRNYSRGKAKRVRTLFLVGLVYSHSRADIERAIALLTKILSAHPRVSDPLVVFRGFGASTLDLQVIFWGDYADNVGYNTLLSELNLDIKERFDAARLEFAFPTTTVHLHAAPAPAA